MNAITLLSGGLDSTVLLASLLHDGATVRALSVNYGQRHVTELRAASTIAAHFGVEHRIADLRSLLPFLRGSSQTSPEIAVPHGHYAAETMKQTVVPNRNMILLSVAAAWAISTGSETIAYAAHAGDHAIYPDCRPEFMDAMGVALGLADWHTLALYAPFRARTKADIVSLGHALGAPLSHTWSCYEGAEQHCGKCGTCCERQEAFTLAEVPDPTAYLEPA